ncbi:DUF3168 domain-containing protein [Undibacterium aquatile]|uniref:DUF3168 domain-containing protein n=1 Tax=Undibacterium aquatile TaxID=1537398 RepID=A0ABR6XF21_9BURK|nr:DUF3168 domain-containing protein [Undibacterium aquatile]MBC3811333.1 DUF3168 domain-containing protein [Undibacterium aquatile]
MLIEEALFTALNASPQLSALPIRPYVAGPNDAAPYIVWSEPVGKRSSSLQGDSGLANPRFQIDVYSPDVIQASQLRKAVRDAILDSPILGAVHLIEGGTYEPDTKLFRYWQDFSLWFYD